MVTPLINYLQEKGSRLLLRQGVQNITKTATGSYSVQTPDYTFETPYLISGVPLNNFTELCQDDWAKKLDKKTLPSKKLNSAFQMGIAFKPHKEYEAIHHQIHLKEPLPETGSHSIFLSLNHPDDTSRSDELGLMVASVSTHIADPENHLHIDKEKAALAALQALQDRDLIRIENIVYRHASAPAAWQQWTGRKYGFVGGYPQFMNIKPWQMQDARLDGDKAYICGDTAYPGQGIPGAALSGIIAWQKLSSDWLS